eukprot:jgi/Botrbrau1/14014/Bobra.0310s0001.1
MTFRSQDMFGMFFVRYCVVRCRTLSVPTFSSLISVRSSAVAPCWLCFPFYSQFYDQAVNLLVFPLPDSLLMHAPSLSRSYRSNPS